VARWASRYRNCVAAAVAAANGELNSVRRRVGAARGGGVAAAVKGATENLCRHEIRAERSISRGGRITDLGMPHCCTPPAIWHRENAGVLRRASLYAAVAPSHQQQTSNGDWRRIRRLGMLEKYPQSCQIADNHRRRATRQRRCGGVSSSALCISREKRIAAS